MSNDETPKVHIQTKIEAVEISLGDVSIVFFNEDGAVGISIIDNNRDLKTAYMNNSEFYNSVILQLKKLIGE